LRNPKDLNLNKTPIFKKAKAIKDNGYVVGFATNADKDCGLQVYQASRQVDAADRVVLNWVGETELFARYR
jgi:hypothetical protein